MVRRVLVCASAGLNALAVTNIIARTETLRSTVVIDIKFPPLLSGNGPEQVFQMRG
jgi:hypothetical protein